MEELGPFDFVFGGSPCNDLSIANPVRRGICGQSSDLIVQGVFWHQVFVSLLIFVSLLFRNTQYEGDLYTEFCVTIKVFMKGKEKSTKVISENMFNAVFR